MRRTYFRVVASTIAMIFYVSNILVASNELYDMFAESCTDINAYALSIGAIVVSIIGILLVFYIISFWKEEEV